MSETPKQIPARHCSTVQLQYELRLQKVDSWHLAYKCPGCGFVQSAETLRRAGVSFHEIEQLQQMADTCRNCGRSVIASRDGRPADLDARLVIVDRRPLFEPATPEEAQALKASWRPQ